jgi:uncharacterized protein (TIGR03437 family)
MTYLAALTILCAAFLPAAHGQNVSANPVTGMGYLYPPVTVAPGQLITVFLAGNAQGDISAIVQGLSAPVLEVRPGSGCASASLCSGLTAITIQIPYELNPGCGFINPVCNVVLLTQLIVTASGVAGAPIDLMPLPDQVHILTACDTVVPSGGGTAPFGGLPCAPLVTHADGSLVTAGSPAQGGEEVVAYAVGLGLTTPAVKTGQAASTATPTSETFYLDFNFRPNALATQPMLPAVGSCCVPRPAVPVPLYSGLVPGYAGLYQVNFVVPPPPAGVAACAGTVQSNLTVSVGGLTSFDGAGICVAPSE